MKLYISRLRQPNGTWEIDDEPRTLKETRRLEKINRCIGGIVTQIWPLDEAKKQFPEVFAKAKP